MKMLLLLPILQIGCYSKHLVLQAEAISMTQENAQQKELKVGALTEEKWCMGDDPVFKEDKSELFGLVDQVVYKAQKEAANADFITSVRVWRDSDGCAILKGRVAHLSES